MEFVEGETLEKLIKHSGRLEVKLALEIAAQVAAGLTAVHEQNLVHRDIKPTNIMVRLKEEGAVTAKIIDLGLAKTVNEPSSQTSISMPCRGDVSTSARAASARKLKGVPQPVVVLLELFLEKDPRRRFQTPTEFLKAMPTITGAINTRRIISRQTLQKTLSSDSRAVVRKAPKRQFEQLAELPVRDVPAADARIWYGDLGSNAVGDQCHLDVRLPDSYSVSPASPVRTWCSSCSASSSSASYGRCCRTRAAARSRSSRKRLPGGLPLTRGT
jgi:serine/threonine protein kinase